MAAVILFAAETLVPAAAADSRETIRLTVLDLCVMSESQKRQVRDKIADECRCASASVAKNMSDAEVKAFKDQAHAPRPVGLGRGRGGLLQELATGS